MMRIKVVGIIVLFCALGAESPAHAACTGAAGYPNTLANGQIADATQVMADFNYAVGCIPAFVGGTSTGSANAQMVASGGFSQSVGNQVTFVAGYTNTGSTTLNVNGTGAAAVMKRSSSGLTALAASDLYAGQQYMVAWDGTQYQLLTPYSGSGGGGPVNLSALQFDSIQLYLLSAINGGWAAGNFISANGSYDAFNADTLSGVSGTTGQTYDSVNKLYSSTTGSVIQEASPATTSYGGAQTLAGEHIAALTNGTIVTKIGANCSSAQTLTVMILKWNSGEIYDVVYSQSFSHPGGGWADASLTSSFSVPSTGTYRVAIYTPGGGALQATANMNSHYYSGLASGTGVNFSLTNNDPLLRYTQQSASSGTMTLVGPALSPAPATAPVTAQLLVLWKDLSGSAVLNTDFTAEVSENGGTTWVLGTLVDSGLQMGAGFHALTASITLPGSGTAVQYRLKTLNAKSQQVKGVSLMVQ